LRRRAAELHFAETVSISKTIRCAGDFFELALRSASIKSSFHFR